MNVCVDLRSRKNISFPMWRILMTMTTMTTKTMRKMTLHLTMTRRPPAPQTPMRQQAGTPDVVRTLSRVPLIPSYLVRVSAPVRRPPRGAFGTADEPPLQAAGERCFPGGAGRHHQELFRPAVRVVPQVTVSRPAWSCPHPSTASPPGPSCPHRAVMSRPPLREDHLPSDLFHLIFPSYPAATGHHNLGLCHRSECYIGSLDTCPGRATVQIVVM